MLISLYAQTLKIMIIDNNKIPVEDAIVNDGYTIQLSDSLGYFRLNTKDKASDYTISKTGFASQTLTKSTLIKRKRIVLKRQNILFDAIHVIEKEEEISSQIRNKEIVRLESVEKKNLNSIADWLNTQQGVQIKGLDLTGEKKTISLGGHSARHTIIMLDGVVLNSAGQDIDLSLLNQENIESIEIIKNNATIEAGTGAIAGLIKIRSKRFANESKIKVSNAFGSFSSLQNAANVTLLDKKMQIDLYYSRQESKNNFIFYNRQLKQNVRRENNSKFQEQFNIIGISTIKNYVFSYNTSFLDYKNYLPGTYNYAQAFAGSYIKGYSFKNTFNMQSQSTENIVYINIDNNKYQNLDSPIPLYRANNKNYQQISGAKSAYKFKLAGIESKNGFEYKNEHFKTDDVLKPSASIPTLKRDTYSAYSSLFKEFSYNLFDINTSASIRTDYTKKFKNNASWRFEQSVNYYAFIPVEFYYNYGTSFSLPSFYDLYWKGDSQTIGNPDLQPEKSKGYRLGIVVGDNPRIEQAFWQNDTKNLIHWFRSLNAWKPSNIAKARIQNYETNIKYDFLSYNTFKLSYTRTIAKDKSLQEDGSHSDFYNKKLIYTPDYQIIAGYVFSYLNFSQNFEYQAIGKQYSTRDQLKLPLASYKKANSHTAYVFKYKSFDLKLISSLYNIFNEKYEIYDYIPEPGFYWQATLNIEKKF
ncbi:MAG: TonB-dependent receptor [Candidatus Cloacimonadales bacterium]|nr:TonB-dependent receptor [Candidatus Cloacimonadota bacterium]MDX9977019.1 TonB-dependent receptor [Candidatus Cloacimonadales bacterium]